MLTMYGLMFPDHLRDRRIGLLLKVMGWQRSDVVGLRDMWVEKVGTDDCVITVYAKCMQYDHDHPDMIIIPEQCKACKRDVLSQDYDGDVMWLRDSENSPYITFRFTPPKRLTEEVKKELTFRAYPARLDMGYVWERRLAHVRTDEENS